METIAKDNVLTKMKNIVNRFMTGFKDDFYKYDKKDIKKDHKYIWSIRPTGTDLTCLTKKHYKDSYLKEVKSKTDKERYYIAEKESKDNLTILMHYRNERFYYIADGKIKKIDKETALSHLRKLIKKEII